MRCHVLPELSAQQLELKCLLSVKAAKNVIHHIVGQLANQALLFLFNKLHMGQIKGEICVSWQDL